MVEVLTAGSSDHQLILLSFHLMQTGGEKDWANVVQNAWNAVARDHALGNGFNDRFNNCIRALLKWNQQLHKNVPQELEQKLSLLQQFQREANSDNVTTIKSLKDEISKLLAQEDLKRRQRAERNWYNLGNKNTKFFHACDTQ